MVRRFLADESGATALEQALVTAFVAMAALAVVGLAGARIYAVLDALAAELTGASQTPAGSR